MKNLLVFACLILFSCLLTVECRRRKTDVYISKPSDFLNNIATSGGKRLVFNSDMTVSLSGLYKSKLTIPSNTIIDGNKKKVIFTGGVTVAYSNVKFVGIHFKHCWISGSTDGGDCLQVNGTGVELSYCTLEDGQDELINLGEGASVKASYCQFLNHMMTKSMDEGADKTFEVNKRVANIEVSYSLFQNVSHLCFKPEERSVISIHNNIFKKMVNEAAKLGFTGESYFQYNYYESFPLNHQFVWSDVESGACVFSRGECLGLSSPCKTIKSEVVDGTGVKVNFNGGRCYGVSKTAVWPSATSMSYSELSTAVATAGAPSSVLKRYRKKKKYY